MICKTTILATLLIIVTSTAGQSYYFRHYQVENGLSNNAVICSVQDKKGFLWFGTKDGLNRFDGYSFKVFRTEPGKKGSLGNNFVQSLFEDQNGVLWVGTEKGLYQYDAVYERFSLVPATANLPIREVTANGKGYLWFINGLTLIRYHLARKTLEQYPLDRYFEATSICYSGDSLWIATSKGFLKKYNPVTNSFSSYNLFAHSHSSTLTWIEKIYSTSGGKILAGTANEGVKLFDPATGDYQNIITQNTDKTALFVRNFLQTSAEEYWIATESGIYIYNERTKKIINLRKIYNDPYSISDNAIYTFTKDREGGIWTGTYFGGINYYPKQYTAFEKITPRNDENSLSGNVVREIREDKEGHLWIGTEDAGLNKLDRKTGRITQFKPTGEKGSITYSNIHGLLVNGDELWVGTFEHGIDILNINTGKVVRHYSSNERPSLKSNFIYCMYLTPAKEILIGTTIGAYKYNPGTDDFELLPGMPLYNWYTSLLMDSAGVIWASTFRNGINFYDTRTGKSGNILHDEKKKNSLCSDRVNCVFEDKRKNLWFATEDGLSKFNKKTNSFKNYTIREGLPSNFTISILEDENNRLWISTTKGLVALNPDTDEIMVYTKANGLLTDQFNFSSGFKDASGRMYFGSAKGLISFKPTEFLKDYFTPPCYITGFQVNNKELTNGKENSPLKKSITYTDKIVLPYDQSTFSIDFAALSYTAPEMLKYAYKMEGLDEDWTYLKINRKAYFTGLSPGTYTFKVKAANSGGDWNVKESTLIIEILPPWWLSRWAYGLYAVLIASFIYYLFRSYHLRIKERNRRKMEQLELHKEKELYEAKMDFFTNVAHEIRTPLTLIKGPLEKVVKKAGDMPEIKDSLRIMEKNTSRLVDLTNQLLDFRQTEIKGFSLSFTKENISEIVEDIFASFKPLAEKKNLDFSLAVLPKNVVALIDVEAFNKILTNLLGNAVKYAQTKVEVELLPLCEDDKFFTIQLKNDGYLIPYEMKEKIFEPFFRLKETEKQKGTGIGLALSRSLTQLHKGFLELKRPENGMNVFSLMMPFNQDGVETKDEVKPVMKQDNETTDITGR
ncbi:ligand-binding sensor domain-containing protein [Terrimonas pollutisoli]|uniref:ligand-binding sensor domain-containing protein n=1 Tax=Terrimonas pollutisoli TaxID=3034147 RepID=UPI0023ED0917|nr:two-component regulator propeller domain-containing protein [Terrimonas sp. H1YJ31]